MKLSKIIDYIKNSTGIKYLFSSGVAFVINYAILVLLELWLAPRLLLGAEIAMVCAWLTSSASLTVRRFFTTVVRVSPCATYTVRIQCASTTPITEAFTSNI